MNLRFLAAGLMIPLALSSCKLIQLPFNLVRSITGGLTQYAPAAPDPEQADAPVSEIALKDNAPLPLASSSQSHHHAAPELK